MSRMIATRIANQVFIAPLKEKFDCLYTNNQAFKILYFYNGIIDISGSGCIIA